MTKRKDIDKVAQIEAVAKEALRRLHAETPPLHFRVFRAAVVEGLGTEAIMALHGVSRANAYQIKRRIGQRFKKIVAEVMAQKASRRV